jgi:hypothetical protein
MITANKVKKSYNVNNECISVKVLKIYVWISETSIYKDH